MGGAQTNYLFLCMVLNACTFELVQSRAFQNVLKINLIRGCVPSFF